VIDWNGFLLNLLIGTAVYDHITQSSSVFLIFHGTDVLYRDFSSVCCTQISFFSSTGR